MLSGYQRSQKADINRHLTTHNQYPGDLTYWLTCLESMPCNDGKYFVTPMRYPNMIL